MEGALTILGHSNALLGTPATDELVHAELRRPLGVAVVHEQATSPARTLTAADGPAAGRGGALAMTGRRL